MKGSEQFLKSKIQLILNEKKGNPTLKTLKLSDHIINSLANLITQTAVFCVHKAITKEFSAQTLTMWKKKLQNPPTISNFTRYELSEETLNLLKQGKNFAPSEEAEEEKFFKKSQY